MNQRDQSEWEEARRRCRLSNEDIRMAKELGFRPKALVKNIPSPSQKWKAPVRVWVRDLYDKKFGSRVKAGSPPKPRNPEYSWPASPEIPELVLIEATGRGDDNPFEFDFAPLSEEDIDQWNTLILRRQCLLRWAAQAVAIAICELPEVQRVAAFGTVAQPLRPQVPGLRNYLGPRIEMMHDCTDLDLAVWLTGLPDLKQLKNAMSRGLSFLQDTQYGAVAHRQVDVHVLDAGNGDYRGRLCGFGQCPQPGKRECHVHGCGVQPFLRQFEGFHWNAAQFEGDPRVILFDRATEFLVGPPIVAAKPARIVYRAAAAAEYFDDEDIPF